MVSKKRLIVIILITMLITSFATYTFGNYALVKSGNKILISNEDYQSLVSLEKKYSKFEKLINHAKDNFLYEVNEEKMIEGGLKGFLSALGDPYTEYMTPKEYNSLIEQTQGSYVGIGVYVTPSDDNRIMVVSPIEDTPAEKAGLKPGDKIIKVNDVEYTADKMDDAIKIMKGEPNTSVKLTILRLDENGKAESFNVDIIREKIKLVTVKSALLDNNIGYIRITTFDEQTAQDFVTKYNELAQKGIKSLIVDLRNNPGGLINTSVDITSLLVGKDKGPITYTKTKNGEREDYPSKYDKIPIPYVLLVNEGSASASEIMSGAVKDTNSGTIIGTKTFGKGIVQRIQLFDTDGSGVKMTISEYFTPSGVNIHGIGIEPNIVVELNKDAEGYGPEYLTTDNQLQKAIEVLMEKMQ